LLRMGVTTSLNLTILQNTPQRRCYKWW
jgi:hypothetical protein